MLPRALESFVQRSSKRNAVTLQLFRRRFVVRFNPCGFNSMEESIRAADAFVHELSREIKGSLLPWRRDIRTVLGTRKGASRGLPAGIFYEHTGFRNTLRKTGSVIASWTTAEGKLVRRRYSVKKYSWDGALKRAISARSDGVRELVQSVTDAETRFAKMITAICSRHGGELRQTEVRSESGRKLNRRKAGSRVRQWRRT